MVDLHYYVQDFRLATLIRLLVKTINPIFSKSEVIAKFQKAQDFFSEAEDKKGALLYKIR